MTATIGRIVHYQLTDYDAEAINKRRTTFAESTKANGDPGTTGFVAHIGNRAAEGQWYPALVVRHFGSTTVNLQVFLDGSDTYWATSRAEGDTPGSWCWPPGVGVPVGLPAASVDREQPAAKSGCTLCGQPKRP